MHHNRHQHLYNSKQWKAQRLEQLGCEPLCRYCMDLGTITQATIADHVVPHKGDTDLFFNGELQSLCKRCHDGAKQQLERSGHLRGGDVSGLPLDANHHWNK